jgi:hypothetical protein
MRFWLCLAAAIATPLLVVAACSSDDGTTPPAPDAGSVDVPAPTDAGGKEEPDVFRSTDGCLLYRTGFKNGTSAQALPRADVPSGVAWTNPAGAQAPGDQAFASVVLDEGQETAELRLGEFKLDVPDSAETWGIEVELKRQAPEGGVLDAEIAVVIEGEGPTPKILKAPWPRSIVGTHVYGQAIDTWKVNLFPRHVNRQTFAAIVRAKKDPDGGVPGAVTALVDSVRVQVWYCPK